MDLYGGIRKYIARSHVQKIRSFLATMRSYSKVYIICIYCNIRYRLLIYLYICISFLNARLGGLEIVEEITGGSKILVISG